MSASNPKLIDSVFTGSSEMAARMRALDWSATPLGFLDQWPQALRTSVRIVLGGGYAMAIFWGSDFTYLYNDAYIPLIGTKHPWALGRHCREVYAEAWDFVRAIYDEVVREQRASFLADQPAPINRSNYLEDCYFTMSISPIPDDRGNVGGVLVTVLETTERVLEERRRELLRNLASRAAGARNEEEVWRASAVTLSENRLSLPFAFLYEYRPSEHQAYLAGASVETDEALRPPVIDCHSENLWRFDPALTRDGVLVELGDRASGVPVPNWASPPKEACVVPIRLGGHSEALGFLVAGIHPGRAFDDAYREFVHRIAEQITIGLASARAYEQERQRAEALTELDRAKTTFFSNVSHEFRTPLTLMLGPLEEVLSAASERLSQEHHEQLIAVRRNGLRLLKLVNTLLDFSRIEAGRVQASYQPTDLASFTSEIASAFDSAMHNAGLRFSVACQPLADPVYVDRDMWEKIVLNLLSNALKFTFEGDVDLTVKPLDSAVELRVRDTGVGIPEEHRERMFERFHRIEGAAASTYEGTGIGLALVQELVKLHGGSVRVESAVGAGSTFTVTIPRGKEHLPAERIEAERTHGTPSLAATKIRAEAYIEEAQQWDADESGAAVDGEIPGTERELIILADDNADMRRYLARLLGDRYAVRAVADGRQALEAIQELRPALVLTDVMMPRLDGFGLLRAIRDDSALADTPVILLSARAGEESRVLGLQADADDYLVKPFTTRELLARVAMHVKMANLRRETAEREERLRSEAELEREKLRASEERLAETGRLYRELQRADAELQLQVGLLQQLPVSAWTLTPDGTPDFVNQVWLEFSGQTLDFIQSRPEAWMTAVHPEDREAASTAFWAGVRSGQGFAFETRSLRAQDGTYRWHLNQAVVLRDAEGKVLKFVGTTTDIDDQKRAEEKLRESEYEARLTVDSIPGMVAVVSTSGEVMSLSKPLLDYYGKSLEEINSQWTTGGMIHPEDRPGLIEAFTRSLASGDPTEFELRACRFDGAYRWFDLRGRPLRDRQGRIARWYFLQTDIDDQKRAEEALRESEHESRLIVDSIPGMIAVLDTSGELERVSQPLLDYFRRSLEECRQWAIDDSIHPDDRPGYLQAFERSFAAGDPVDYEAVRVRRFDGVYRWFDVRGLPLRDRQGHIVRWYFLFTEIDDKKRAEDKIRQSEKEARQLLDLSPLHIAEFGPHEARLYLNLAALDYLGITLEQWKDAGLQEMLHRQDAEIVGKELPGKFQSGSPFEYEVRLRRKDGEYRWFHYRFSPVSNEEGRITRWYAAGTDIDDRKLAEQRLQEENVALREEIDKASMFDEIVGGSAPLKKVLSRISKVAPTDSSVLITGETGTGKELVARAIHRRSRRSSYPFVSVNCAVIPRDLIASELFGHEKGAFTGATQRRLGRFELAEKGTIFLDEVGELPAETQIALLRVLQEREFERIGGTGSMKTDVRVVAATNRDLEAAIAAGTFRSDLYYRLNVFPIEMPTLGERREDIPLLVTYFLNRFARKAGRRFTAVDKKSLDLLQSYAWPGNIRELQNVIERSVIVSETPTFSVDESWLSRRPSSPDPSIHESTGPSLFNRSPAEEKAAIEAALRECGGRVYGPSGAAAKLGIPRSTLETKIRALKINKHRFKGTDLSTES